MNTKLTAKNAADVKDIFNTTRLFLRDNRSVCPKCSGFITTIRQNHYICIDCRKIYAGIGCGNVDGEVIVKETKGAAVMETGVGK